MPITVTCERCGAAPGEMCRDLRMTNRNRAGFHKERLYRWDKERAEGKRR